LMIVYLLVPNFQNWTSFFKKIFLLCFREEG